MFQNVAFITSATGCKSQGPFPLHVCSPPGAVKKEVYFMAIIDILTHYDAKKKAAHAAKTVKHGVSAMEHNVFRGF